MVASIVLHIVILHSYCLLENMNPRLRRLSNHSHFWSCSTITVWCFGKNIKGRNAKTTTKTSNTKEVSKSQKKRRKVLRKKQGSRSQRKNWKKKKQKKKNQKEIKKKEPEKKEETKKEVKKKEPEKTFTRRIATTTSVAQCSSKWSWRRHRRKNCSPDGSDNPPDGPRIEKVKPIAKYVQDCHDAIFPNWAANAALSSKSWLKVTVKVIVRRWTMSNPEIYASSLNRSFDRSATMAMLKTKKLPPPPPQYRQNAKAGVFITLSAKDKLWELLWKNFFPCYP